MTCRTTAVFCSWTPSRQCPTGARLPIDRRKRLLELAEARDLTLIEDDFESNFGLTTDASAAMRGMDASGRVLYVAAVEDAGTGPARRLHRRPSGNHARGKGPFAG